MCKPRHDTRCCLCVQRICSTRWLDSYRTKWSSSQQLQKAKLCKPGLGLPTVKFLMTYSQPRSQALVWERRKVHTVHTCANFPFSTHTQEPGNKASLQYAKTVSNQKLDSGNRLMSSLATNRLNIKQNKTFAKLYIYEHILVLIFKSASSHFCAQEPRN